MSHKALLEQRRADGVGGDGIEMNEYGLEDTEVASTHSWCGEYARPPEPVNVEKNLESRILGRGKTPIKSTIQGKVYNFLERPTGWKCFVYHFTV